MYTLARLWNYKTRIRRMPHVVPRKLDWDWTQVQIYPRATTSPGWARNPLSGRIRNRLNIIYGSGVIPDPISYPQVSPSWKPLFSAPHEEPSTTMLFLCQTLTKNPQQVWQTLNNFDYPTFYHTLSNFLYFLPFVLPTLSINLRSVISLSNT